MDDLSGRVSYEVKSFDEAAFVVASREMGLQFCQRTQNNVSLNKLDYLSGTIKKRHVPVYFCIIFICTSNGVCVSICSSNVVCASIFMKQLLTFTSNSFSIETFLVILLFRNQSTVW